MSKVLPYPAEVKSTFFYDEKFILKFDNRLLQEAKGHLILIHESNDFNLKVAALLDGSAIDFLFGVRNNSSNKMKAEMVKSYIREQNQDLQILIAKFYYVIYHNIINYYNSLNENNLLTCFGSCFLLVEPGLRKKLFDNINEGYSPVYMNIYSISKH